MNSFIDNFADFSFENIAGVEGGAAAKPLRAASASAKAKTKAKATKANSQHVLHKIGDIVVFAKTYDVVTVGSRKAEYVMMPVSAALKLSDQYARLKSMPKK